jgi:transcriptional regulator with XRE-family HTH domain
MPVVAEQPVLGFGGLLRRLRARARLTQEELAEAAGLSPRSVSDLERGINRTARKATAELLAGALGLAEPARGLFVAAARGRGPAADVLVARQEQADPRGLVSAPDHRQTQIVSPPPGFPGPVLAAPAADAVPPVTKTAPSPAYSAAGQAGARPDAGPAVPPGDGEQRAIPSPREDHPRADAGAPGPGEKMPRAARPVGAIQLGGLWPFAAAGVIVVVTVAGLVVMWPSSHRADLAGFARFALSVAVIAAGWIAWIWRHKGSQGSEVVAGQELERLADLLAGAIDREWTRAAGERGLLEPEPIPVRWQRATAPFAGPVAAAVASTRFAPLPGLAAAQEQRLQAGQVNELHELYGGLGSGRLVIAGRPGAGKSSAAVLLILAALRYRRNAPEPVRPQVPVPVMFTLHGWDPSTQRARDWLAGRLRQTYPLFAGKQGARIARGMLDEGRIAVILDGLDEIPENLRPTMLQALSQQATFRLVLLTRSAEMADAAARALLQGAAAIELQDIDPGIAADYLIRTQLDPPPQDWQELTTRLREQPGSPLAQTLNNPLMLTLVRDTYRAGITSASSSACATQPGTRLRAKTSPATC